MAAWRSLILGVCAVCLAAGCTPSNAPHFHAMDIRGANYAQDFALADPAGKPRQLADFKGRAVVLFFGYTQCPDICPTTLSTLAGVMEQLGPQASRVQVVFVTIDPERDTPALLAEYVPAFHPGFLGLRPTPAQMDALKQTFRLVVEKSGDIAHNRYTVNHSAGLYIYDPQGRLRLFVQHGAPSEDIAADLRLLLAGS